MLRHQHRPVVVAAVLLTTVAMDVWLFGFFGAIEPVLEINQRCSS